MNKFSLRDQQHIVGSFDKLRQFKEGASLEGIFNSVRPNYPIKKYSEVFGYNSGMEILNHKNILKTESYVIHDWLIYDACKNIRASFYGEKVDEKYRKEALILENMFTKYDSNLNKDEHIYRGIRFRKNDDLFDILVNTYKEASRNDGLIRIDKAPSSFSRNKKVAYEEFARVNDNSYNSLVFHLTKRKKGELYIKDFAGKFAYQDEIVIKSHNSLYKVKSINENDGLTIIYIEEY